MVEVGELTIGGSIDTSEIESGLLRIQVGFDKMESKTDGINSDFQRMATTGKSLNKTLLGIAAAGATAMFAIAKDAPAVAGSMAMIEIESGKLERSLGRGLAPVFDLASDAFGGFVGAVQENEGVLGFLSNTFSDDIRQKWNDGATVIDFVKDKVSDLGEAIGINKEDVSDFFGKVTEFDFGMIGFPSPFGAVGRIADLIRSLNGNENNETRRSLGQILQDWI